MNKQPSLEGCFSCALQKKYLDLILQCQVGKRKTAI